MKKVITNKVRKNASDFPSEEDALRENQRETIEKNNGTSPRCKQNNMGNFCDVEISLMMLLCSLRN